MTLKQRILASAFVLLLMLVVGLAGIWYLMEYPPRATREARAGMLGSGTATLGCLVLAGLWLPCAYQVGARKRAEREGKSRTTSRSR